MRSVKEKRFYTPLSMAVPQNSLRYAMGARQKRSDKDANSADEGRRYGAGILN